MNIRLDIKLTDTEFEKLWNKAAQMYMREEPRKAWTPAEKKDAVRWYLMMETRARIENT